MAASKQNGSFVLGNMHMTDSDQEESGKTRVLVHQDAFDAPEVFRRDIGGADRPQFLEPKQSKICRNQLIEPDDIITPLSEDSSPAGAGKKWPNDSSTEQIEENSSNCIGTFLPCCGDLFEPTHITFGKFIGLISCFIFYVGNLAMNAVVCYHLFLHGNFVWFSLVAAFTLVPTVILNTISYHLSVSKMVAKRSLWNQSESFIVSVIIALLHLTQFGVVARYFGYMFLHELEYLWVIFCPNEKRKDFDHRSGKYVELPYLPFMFMVEAMLQCLPQLLVQFYILVEGWDTLARDTVNLLIISITISLLNLTRLQTLCKHIRKKFSTSWCGLSLIVLWHFFTNISRIVSSALFMDSFAIGFGLLCLFHWIIMSIWATGVLTGSTPWHTMKGFYKNARKYLKGMLYGIVYLLCFIELNISDNQEETPSVPSRYLYVFFYSVIFLENSVMITLWFIYSSYSFGVLAFVTTFASFFIGIFFMCIYYRIFHRNVQHSSKRWHCIFKLPTRNDVV